MKGEEEMRAKECAGEMDKEGDKMKSCDKGDVRCEEEEDQIRSEELTKFEKCIYMRKG